MSIHGHTFQEQPMINNGWVLVSKRANSKARVLHCLPASPGKLMSPFPVSLLHSSTGVFCGLLPNKQLSVKYVCGKNPTKITSQLDSPSFLLYPPHHVYHRWQCSVSFYCGFSTAIACCAWVRGCGGQRQSFESP